MGAPKALLPDGSGRLFVTRLLHTLGAAGFNAVTVVTGALHGRIVQAISHDAPANMSIAFARNAHPSRGQLSSLVTGIDAAARPGVRAVLVTLVDVPFVSIETIRAVVSEYARTGAPILRPARGDRHGHPVLFDAALFDELRRADPEAGAKAVLRAHTHEIVNVAVEDDGAFVDVDTRAEYDRVVGS